MAVSTVADRRTWTTWALSRLDAEATRCGETPLLQFPLPVDWGIDLYLKDESKQPTGSLKHRLARALFMYALCNGRLEPGRRVIEASSGSTAVSEAYFAQLLGLPFVAVMPRGTSRAKIDRIVAYGGTCHLVDDPRTIYAESERLALETGGLYLDQFTYAERASDWTGPLNIAAGVLDQLSKERHPVPRWVSIGAGTGGTSATFGRYLRLAGYDTAVCVADPEGSAYACAWETGDLTTTATGSRIEGIGRPRVEASFIPELVDSVVRVPDGASIAAMRFLSVQLGQPVGGSTGTALWAALEKITAMRAAEERGSVVAIICDAGDRYLDTYYDDAWVASQGIDLAPYTGRLSEFATPARG
ncbi:pyridoxal-phosphate dependent enzyme [Pseudactinotalea sp. HY158]|nr:pyridoxal-phosphate dependent enzyme [Pseudactinotalea sp. HY158]